jgi:arginine-tRNA-protein transferase
MFAEVKHPETLTPDEIDSYLLQGWFRMGPTIFTTNFLSFKDTLYGAIWLRVNLETYKGERAQTRLFKLNHSLRTEIKKAEITEEKEKLFAVYKASVTFEASASVRHLLLGKSQTCAYDTYEVNVYDDQKLIACGYFDLGSTSAMGISCFYDPAYKKHSLGKYLIYQKMAYCQKVGLKFFYPGYFVPGYSYFDYKLTMGKDSLEYLQLETQQWHPIKIFSAELAPLAVMRSKLTSLQERLISQGVSSVLMRYEFFDANLIPDLAGANLFDFPLFLFIPGSLQEPVNQFVIYDVMDQQYHLVRCRGIWKTNSGISSDATYSSYVLKVEDNLFSAPGMEMIAALIAIEKKQLLPKTGSRS